MGMGIDLEPGVAEVRELSRGWILGGSCEAQDGGWDFFLSTMERYWRVEADERDLM